MRTFVTAALAACVLLGAAACDDDADEPDERFVAHMTGAAERPDPVDTDATGTARFERRGEDVSFSIDVEDITAVTAAHIHAPAGVNQTDDPVVMLFLGPVTGDVNGRLVDDSFDGTTDASISLDSLLVLMREGQAYVNVHTTAHPSGEIRGQIEPD